MKDYRIAERYASALCELIEDDAQLDHAAQNLTQLRRVVMNNHDLHSALANPAIDIEARVRLLHGILEKLDVPKGVERLVEVLLRRGRIDWFTAVSRVFNKLVDQRLNRVGATVTTAAELDEEQETRLREALERFSGKTVRMEVEVNPELLGGVIADIGGKLIDGSVRTRLNRLKNTLITEEIFGA